MDAQLARRLRQAALVAALAVLGYLGLAILSDLPALAAGLQRLSAEQWLALLGLSLLNYGLRFARWHVYLTRLGARIAPGHHLWIYLAGFAFTLTPGKAGEAVRSVYLRAAGVPWPPGLAALAVERILDLTAMILLAMLVFARGSASVWPLIAIAALAAGLLLVTRPGVANRLCRQLPDAGRLGRLRHGLGAILDDARRLLTPGWLLTGLLVGLAAWGAEAWGLWLLLGWLDVGSPPALAMGIYAAGMIGGALSFLPGGLGGAEATMVALLRLHAVPLGTAVLATLICRAVTLWFAVLLGIGAVLRLGLLTRIPPAPPDASASHAETGARH